MSRHPSPARTVKRRLPLGMLLALAGLLVTWSPVEAAPRIDVTPEAGAVGTRVTVTGSVFDSYKGDIMTISFNGQEIAEESPFEIPDTGTFEIPYTIPAGTPPGNYLFHVETVVGGSQFSSDAVFKVEAPALVLDLTEGPVGTSVTATGRGFYAESTVTVAFLNPGEDSTGTRKASAVGRFEHVFLIPAGTGGVHSVKASNTEGNTATTPFTIIPGITTNVATGGPGDVIHLTGTGFGFRSNVRVSLGTAPVATARADDYGGFEIDFNVPELTSGPYDIRAEDAVGNLNLAPFIVTAGARLSVTTGAVGSNLTAFGSGFKAGGTVAVDFGPLRAASVTADANGAFSTTFGVPTLPAGSYTVTISDGTLTRQILYTIESDPPAVPVLVLPADGATSRSSGYLDWEDVSDPSKPVTYDLQVASDSGFAALVVIKAGLTESEYAMSENLTVPNQSVRYYWRVRATDAAGNQGQWTAARSFVISPPPAPTLATTTAAEPTATATTGASTVAAPVATPTAGATLDWEPVSNPTGPVSYTIEIADNPEFTDPVLEKTGLTSSNYLLNQSDLLGLKDKVPYYWRVKAVDADGVSSDWSAPGTFTVGASGGFPAWGIWVIAGLGVAALIFLAFRLGRRTAYGSPD